MKNNTLLVFTYELRRNFLRRGYLFASFGIPILAFILMFGYQFITDLNAGNQTPEEEPEFDFRGIETAGFVDLSGQFGELDEQSAEVLKPFSDETTAQAALAEGEIDTYYVIEADYLETRAVRQVMPELSFNLLTGAPIEQIIFSTLAKEISPSTLLRLRFPANFQEVNLERSLPDGAVQNQDADILLVYVFSIVFLLALFLTNGYLLQSVIEEKETRLIEIMISTIRPTQLLSGKILAFGVLGLLQVVIWGAALILLVRVSTSLSAFATTAIPSVTIPIEMMPIMLLYFVLGYLLFAAAYGAVGALSNSMREGPQYAVIFTLPAALPYYFFTIFVETPNGPLPTIFSLFPLTAPISMMMRLTVSNVPLLELLLSLALLAATVVLMIWLAGRLFRVQTLLSGQVPKLRDIPKLLRG